MTLDEVLAVAELGARQGCTEALFTLGILVCSHGLPTEPVVTTLTWML